MMFIFLLFGMCLIGCSNIQIPYNALILKEEYELSKTFIDENLTYGSIYDKKIFDEVNNEFITKSLVDKTSPKERVCVVKDLEMLESIFSTFPEIDLETKMIVLHGFTTASNSDYKISNVCLNNGEITIEYGNISKGISSPNCSLLMTKWVVIELDKLDYDKINVSFIGRVK